MTPNWTSADPSVQLKNLSLMESMMLSSPYDAKGLGRVSKGVNRFHNRKNKKLACWFASIVSYFLRTHPHRVHVTSLVARKSAVYQCCLVRGLNPSKNVYFSCESSQVKFTSSQNEVYAVYPYPSSTWAGKPQDPRSKTSHHRQPVTGHSPTSLTKNATWQGMHRVKQGAWPRNWDPADDGPWVAWFQTNSKKNNIHGISLELGLYSAICTETILILCSLPSCWYCLRAWRRSKRRPWVKVGWSNLESPTNKWFGQQKKMSMSMNVALSFKGLPHFHRNPWIFVAQLCYRWSLYCLFTERRFSCYFDSLQCCLF